MLPEPLDPGETLTMADRLLAGYRAGAFPMGDPSTGEIDWFEADPRAIIPLEPGGFRISRRLARTIRSGKFEVTSNTAFDAVVRSCAAARPGREDTWITPELMSWYDELREGGHAHSVEAWWTDEAGSRCLVGGLYGVQTGGAFFAESKFSLPEAGGTDASKVCLAHLVRHMRARAFALLDVQLSNAHLEQFEIQTVPARQFRVLLDRCVEVPTCWDPWSDYASIE